MSEVWAGCLNLGHSIPFIETSRYDLGPNNGFQLLDRLRWNRKQKIRNYRGMLSVTYMASWITSLYSNNSKIPINLLLFLFTLWKILLQLVTLAKRMASPGLSGHWHRCQNTFGGKDPLRLWSRAVDPQTLFGPLTYNRSKFRIESQCFYKYYLYATLDLEYIKENFQLDPDPTG